MLNIVVCGMPQRGKTTWCMKKAASLGFPIIANDPVGQWKQQPLLLRELLDRIEARKGLPTTVVWEEASGYLSGIGVSKKDQERTVKALTQRYHYRHVNLLVFHSVRMIPVWVMDFTDYLVLFKTKDRPGLMASKYRNWPELTDAIDRVRLHRDPHRFEIVPIFAP